VRDYLSCSREDLTKFDEGLAKKKSARERVKTQLADENTSLVHAIFNNLQYLSVYINNGK
jgi:hypothetical protein